MTQPPTPYPNVPVEQLPKDLRDDLAWITPWLFKEFPDDPRRIDWYRYGRDSGLNPIFSQLILYDGKNVGFQEGRKLVDEQQMGRSILETLGVHFDEK